MGDRANCELRLEGIASMDTAMKICGFIRDEAGIVTGNSIEDDVAKLERNGYAEFEEMNYGQIPTGIETLLREARISFAWTWESGCEYPAGALIYDGLEDQVAEFSTLSGEIAIPASLLNNTDITREACRWQERLSRIRCRFAVARSSHDLVALRRKACMEDGDVPEMPKGFPSF